jgi:hypothetical protein
LTKNWLGFIFGNFFHKLIWSACCAGEGKQTEWFSSDHCKSTSVIFSDSYARNSQLEDLAGVV